MSEEKRTPETVIADIDVSTASLREAIAGKDETTIFKHIREISDRLSELKELDATLTLEKKRALYQEFPQYAMYGNWMWTN